MKTRTIEFAVFSDYVQKNMRIGDKEEKRTQRNKIIISLRLDNVKDKKMSTLRKLRWQVTRDLPKDLCRLPFPLFLK